MTPGVTLTSRRPLQVDSETLACTYAALILHDEGLSIDAEGIDKLIKAAGVEVENFWPGMFAKALAGADISELCSKIGSEIPTPTLFDPHKIDGGE
jgi:large subunit ribosomal protein LP1